jgi:hypothetical protein
MIKQSDLMNRANINGMCVDFDYYIQVDENRIRCRFTRDKRAPSIWNMMVVLKRTRDADSQVYNFSYQIPKQNMDLTMITAIGLKYFQMYLKEEVQLKSSLDFAIGEITSGMVG